MVSKNAATRAEKRRKGECYNCNKKAVNKSFCEIHLQKARFNRKKRYAELRNATVCTICIYKPAEPQRKVCADCRTKLNARRYTAEKLLERRLLRLSNKARGLCSASASHGAAVEGRVFCQRCVDSRARIEQRRRKRITKKE